MRTVEDKITVVQEEVGQVLTIKQTAFEALDEVACHVLKNECPKYLMTLNWNKEAGTIEYQVGADRIGLKDYDGHFKINEVIRLYDQIIELCKDCEDYFLHAEGICWDIPYVYLDTQHLAMQVMYIPELHPEINAQEIRELMLFILDKCEETSGERYQVQLYKALYKKTFNWENIKDIIVGIKRKMAAEAWHGMDEEALRLNEKMGAISSSKVYEKEQQASELKEEKEEESEPITPAQRLQKELEQFVHTVYHEQAHYEKPEFEPLKPEQLMTKETQQRFVLKCANHKTRYRLPEKIEIPENPNPFLIGRATKNGEGEKADFEFGIAVTPISRLHAQISKIEGSYYIQDLGSSNGTYLNGMRLDSKADYLLSEGDRIAFAIAYSKNSIEYIFEKE